MKCTVPTVSELIILEEDWKFSLFDEYRNNSILENIEKISVKNEDDDPEWIKKLFPPLYDKYFEKRSLPGYQKTHVDVMLPKGTVLKVSKVYIRGVSKASRSYDSYTFNIQTGPILKQGKFWAKLSDVNTMNISFITLDELKQLKKKKK